eukprot:TRINITY_DN6148_c0_g1_i1.p1 TRINITY_DN6148_c0_g1~~TRINITY_DN6148_c0_g1_i1.p1  ORF type:complete len:362 (-),score=110.18 TRINITY_DN6148_c0_g1_i1:11-1018(-)
MNKTNDKKMEAIARTSENLKMTGKFLREFSAAVSNYSKLSQKVAEEGKKLADMIQRAAQNQSSDLADGLTKIAEAQRSLENKREAICRAMNNELATYCLTAGTSVDAELTGFSKDSNQAFTMAKSHIAKLEANSKKAGKKGGGNLQEIIRDLDTAIKDLEKIKGEKLRSVMLMERKKYCLFVQAFLPALNGQADMANDASGRLQTLLPTCQQLAESSNNLPTDAEQLASSNQERTFVQIQSDEYPSDYNAAPSSYPQDDYYGGSGYQAAPPPPRFSASLAYCTALYDFAGDQPTDLPFYAGDVIQITVEDDGSGWLTGQLNGRTGIFPSSYVQRN